MESFQIFPPYKLGTKEIAAKSLKKKSNNKNIFVLLINLFPTLPSNSKHHHNKSQSSPQLLSSSTILQTKEERFTRLVLKTS